MRQVTSEEVKQPDISGALALLLRHYSAEVVASDRKSVDAAKSLMPKGSEVFVTSLPNHTSDQQIVVARELKQAGLTPVPHLVARNIESFDLFKLLLKRLSTEAGVDRALVLAGDRDRSLGCYSSSLDLIHTGLLSRTGIHRIAISCYPEAHPRIDEATLSAARAAKVAMAADQGMDVSFVSQFCFEGAPIIAMIRRLRSEGIRGPVRVGVAGPASRASLLKYAIRCGVGASVRALAERPSAFGLIKGQTPEPVLREVADALVADPCLCISGVHFFTFASLAATAKFVEYQLRHTRSL
jgi:methylenetetrahydrofolate reductase (NADPH)